MLKRPPSSDGLSRPKPSPASLREKSGKERGGQKGHKGHGLKLPYKIIGTKKIESETCPCCGGDLHDTPGEKIETRYVHEIPKVEVTTTVYENYSKKCPHCGEIVNGEFPEYVSGTQQYGPIVKALIVLLNQYGMTAMNKIKNLLISLFGIKMSEGTISNTIQKCGASVKNAHKTLKEAVLQAQVVHFDETGMRNDGIVWWLHTASTKLLTYLTIHKKRGKTAMDAAGILSEFKGIAVHDCWKPYWTYICLHALCNAHVLRELNGILENTKQEWSAKMIGLLLEMKNVVDLHKEKGYENISAYYTQYFGLEYDKIVQEGLSINPFVAKETGKRGVAKQSKARRLLERLRDHKKEYLLFTEDFDVPFDNNQAERDFRVSKTKQKVSGCFRSDTGAESFATIQSIIQTLRKHKINIFDELCQSFSGSYSLPLEVAATE